MITTTSKDGCIAGNERFQRDHNARVYRRRDVVRRYQRAVSLDLAEAVVLLNHQPAFSGKDVLDIGVGTGRTTPYLAPLAHRYQAIDYSPAMVARFRQNFPEVPVELADMTDLGIFEDASFDFVLATNNVFDAVGHADRLQTLREVRRVLRPHGMLIFSSHNRDVQNLGRRPALRLSRNPVTQLAFTAYWCMKLVNRARLARRQLFTDEYAIVNDGAHHVATLLYFIGPGNQQRQLADAGFELLELFDKWGKPKTPGDSVARSAWLFYVAARTPDPVRSCRNEWSGNHEQKH
ncbi:MAG TPA: class I SAM-dependent methyltransferase [Rhodanobacteraceae bacterium]|nr:class I SAM-dependent methyltransferase [Rhodanobacteraceae bacterium]